MPGFRHGAKRGTFIIMAGFLAGIFVARILPRLIRLGELPPWAIPGVGVATIFSVGLTVKKSKYWSFAYLGGFIIGIGITLLILLQTQFVGLRDLFLYGGAAVAAVALRAKIHI